MNIILEIANLLQTNSIGTVGEDIFIGSLKDELNNAIMLVSTSSGSNRKDYPLYETNIEIWVRNETTANGFDKAQAIFNLLNLRENITTTNAHIYFIHASNGVESIGRDMNGRALHKLMVGVTYRDLLIS